MYKEKNYESGMEKLRSKDYEGVIWFYIFVTLP